VSLVDDDGVLTVTVSDDGDGFDPATTRRGAGLNGITDRIDTIGGTTTITSTPGHGTTITATVPVGPTTSPTMGAASDDMSFATSDGGSWGQRSAGPK
jgi:glucose-6-phosphate-specific signal transduction histidine kinase